LARLGDPRQAVTTLDRQEFCWVPAGDFWMGSEKYNIEKPQHLNKSLAKDYWISRFPITVAQYQIFVNTTNHKPTDPDCLKDPANRPVRLVTWHEALKYCECLTQYWRAQGLLPENWRVNLLSEAEWEKAARGGVKIPERALIRSIREFLSAPLPALVNNDHAKRRFPWGDNADANRANYDDTKIGTTNTVGCFAGGKSRYGCEEISGNVWEWTRSLWGKHWMEPEFEYPYDPNDGRESLMHLTRYSAWFVAARSTSTNVRALRRSPQELPNYWRDNIGFAWCCLHNFLRSVETQRQPRQSHHDLCHHAQVFLA
jgi:formylglycine-generating enzyme required for sulfatase activity